MPEAFDRYTALATGKIPGHSSQIFNGENLDLPNGIQVLPWIGPTDYYIWTTTGFISHMSSSSVLDTGLVLIRGLDVNFELVIQTIQISGQSKVQLETQLKRINSVVSLQNLEGNLYVYEDGDITNGIPDDLDLVRGFVDPESNVMFFSGYTVPACCFAQLYSLTVACDSPSNDSILVKFYTRQNPSTCVYRAQTISFGSGATSILSLNIRGFGFPAMTDVWLEALGPTVNTGISISAAIEEIEL